MNQNLDDHLRHKDELIFFEQAATSVHEYCMSNAIDQSVHSVPDVACCRCVIDGFLEHGNKSFQRKLVHLVDLDEVVQYKVKY